MASLFSRAKRTNNSAETNPADNSRTLRPYPAANEHPAPATGAETRTYEGRPLDRPGEDIEDQGLAFDVATLLGRRKFLGALGLGAGAVALAACSPGSSGASASASSSSASATGVADTTYTEMPTETAGPYPGDGSNGPDVLDMTGVERSDIRSSIGGGATAEGVQITLELNIIDIAGGNVPFTGAAVYVWHCDAEGNYSMYGEGIEDETYLRGVQIAGDDGVVRFTSIMPGCYSGRWPHIHFEVFPDKASISDATNNVLTSQLAIPEDVATQVYALTGYTGSASNLAKITLGTDNVFSDGWDQQVASVTGDASSGYTVSIDVPIDTTTEQEMSGGMPGGGAGGPGGGGTPPDGEPGAGGPMGAPPGQDSGSAGGSTEAA
ncbi:intradiol ring-cleavage dioxygenase [Dietzia timorensis]|uniref:Chlorocatechol 1,2-dioxygenase n=1 Tax=Dietzia timorensis TaxID=499555 RepID=A0A173LHZ4_9ACTN|nr:intradiol ring-cleavage dioxygenase [Dietzia timorensis]ANI91399.1 Chlorocatechol 1,2-dioxygenase [Dietzia timorensis]